MAGPVTPLGFGVPVLRSALRRADSCPFAASYSSAIKEPSFVRCLPLLLWRRGLGRRGLLHASATWFIRKEACIAHTVDHDGRFSHHPLCAEFSGFRSFVIRISSRRAGVPSPRVGFRQFVFRISRTEHLSRRAFVGMAAGASRAASWRLLEGYRRISFHCGSQ